jgi:hypothetical protein
VDNKLGKEVLICLSYVICICPDGDAPAAYKLALLLHQQGRQMFQSYLRKSGAGMITRANVGYDNGRTVGLNLPRHRGTVHALSLPPPCPWQHNHLNGKSNGTQPAS